jgi:alkylated DNA repair dioxygenase AlkB
VQLQRELFPPAPSFDESFGRAQRIELGAGSWVDHAPGWVEGDGALFEEIVQRRDWAQRERWMYERRVLEPRLTAPWHAGEGPLEPPLLEEMRLCLSRRYGVVFDSVGFSLYRGGEDSVAWHRDRIARSIAEPVVALASLGEPRKFLLRKRGGGPSMRFLLGRGDLLVTGGKAQRDFEHCVPKAKRAGPRISLAFRHGMDPRAYGK